MADRDVIADLVAQVTLDGTKFQNGAGKINRGLKLMKEEMKTAQLRTRQFGESTENLENKSRILSNQLRLQKTSVELLDKAHKEAVQSAGAHSKTAQNLAVRLERAKREMIGTEQQINDVNGELREQNGLLTTNRGLWGRTFDNLSEDIKNSKRELEGLQQVMGGALIASGIGFGAAIYSAATFEQALADVKAVSGATGEEMSQLADLAKELGEQTRYSGKQVLEGAQELIKAGIPLEQVLGGALKGALDLATAGELQLAEAAEVASTALNAFEEDGLSVADAADILAGAANASATDVHEMRIGLAQASAVAAGAGLSFEDTSTALALLAQNGLKGSDAGTSLKVMFQRLAPTTDKAKDAFAKFGLLTRDTTEALQVLEEEGIKPASNSWTDIYDALYEYVEATSGAQRGTEEATKAFEGLLDEVGVYQSAFYDANGEIKSMAEISELLQTQLGDLTDMQRQQALETMFGTDAMRAATILYKEGAEGINEMNEEMSKTTAAEVAAVRMDTFIGKLEELKSTLATLGIGIAEDSMGDLTEVVKELTEWIRDLNPDMVAAGLKAVGAAGGFGFLAATLVKVGRGLMLLSGNPIGLTITGLSLLVGAFVGLRGAMEESQEVSYETADALQEQYKKTGQLIDEFDKLRNKSKLTSDEFARYIDLHHALQDATDPEVIKAIRSEMDKLQNKSGLTNEELSKMVSQNETLTETMPHATNKITDQGNEIAGTTEKMKEYNKQTRIMATRELEEQFYKALSQQSELIQKIKDDRAALNRSMSLEAEIQKLLVNYNKQTAQSKIKQYESEVKALDVATQNGTLQGEALEKAKIELEDKRALLTMLKGGKQTLYEQLSIYIEKNNERQKELEKTQKQLSQLSIAKQRLSEQYLIAAGITDEKAQQVVQEGKSISLIETKIGKLQAEKQALIEQTPVNRRNTEEHREAVAEIEKEIGRLQTAKDNIYNLVNAASDYNTEMGQDISKDVNVNVNPSASELDWTLSKPISKKVQLSVSNPNGVLSIPRYAEGTNSHPGGPALVGEEGYELAKHGNRWSMLNFGVADLQQGTQVFTHEESNRIMSALNNIPAYASGISSSGEADRIANRLQDNSPPAQVQTSKSGPLTINLRIGRQQLQAHVDEVSQMLGTEVKLKKRRRGGR
ncbi:phage tail tape measure protein [Halobacillus ihumii]|uniref:phage tail tape measure protein n=1 Tax=Halobacillus ihumii TaxID=2686092 RepID=UPI0013D131F9|nr:phage tail tape measure protein [Halobacillus ihumii]